MKQVKRVGAAVRIAFVMSAVALVGAGCGGVTDDWEGSGATADEIRAASTFTSRGTGYYPDSSALEGGFKDRVGKPLKTLQQFLAGSAPYASVAMDSTAFKYGTRLRIKELNAKYGREIIFRVVDTGGAFRGKGRSRIDVCTANSRASLDPVINATLHIDVIDEAGGADPAPAPPAPSAPPATDPAPDPTPAPGGTGIACSGDGVCNPGNDGSGMICTAGRCVKGCHSNAQCPGATSCSPAGQCQ